MPNPIMGSHIGEVVFKGIAVCSINIQGLFLPAFLISSIFLSTINYIHGVSRRHRKLLITESKWTHLNIYH